LRAWVNRCAHLPLTLDMGSGEFFTAEGSELQCSHHGARYALDSGLCLWGPCKGRSLEPIPFDASDPEFLVLDLSAVDADRPPPPADYVDNS
jgi:nitrite reductase/ring-hydroxylating ferredoxin subunit